jgi:N-acetylneuraminic acid mutarotase
MAKKKGKKDDEKKFALAAKKEAKQEKAARKRLTKQQSADGVAPDEEADLDQVLQAYKSKDKEVMTGKPILEPLDTPFPLARANATLEYCGDEKKDYFYLFGGEYFDGIENIVLDELLRFEVLKKEWKQILTNPRPSPRCAHSCVSYKNCLYVFGGEMATADEYHHYRDLWKFDLIKMQWTEISARNPPSARSGHVTIVWKSYMIVFGGFFEALRETKWYNDVHVFNLQTETWMELPPSRLSAKPDPRSSCNVALYGTDRLIVHGGFSKLSKTSNTAAETKVHTDSWVLHLAPLQQQNPPTWERWMSSSKTGSSNTPNGRAGTSSISYKNRMLVYGGVVDAEQHNHKMDSVFYSDLMALDIERRKWFPLKVKDKSNSGGGRRRRKPKDGDDDGPEDDQDKNENDVDESSSSELEEEEDPEGDSAQPTGWDLDKLRANMFAFVDGSGNIVYEKIEEDDEEEKEEDESKEEEEEEKEEEKEEEEDDEEKEEEKEEEKTETKPPADRTIDPRKIIASSVMVVNAETNAPEAVARTEPLPRINSSVLIRGHTMYLLGGILEVGDREVTLDDMWALDLRKREQWECLWPGTMHKQVWRGAIHDDDDSYISTGKEDGSDDEDDDDDYSDDEGEEGEENEATKKSSKNSKRSGLRQEIAELNETYDLSDTNRAPNSGESLADFYARTADYWNAEAGNQLAGTDEALSNKELKRQGFILARERYDELRPVLDRLAELDLGSSEKGHKESKSEKKKDKSKKSSRR